MNTIDLKQGSKEWLDYRATRIGASDIAKILGVSPYGTAFDLYEEKNGLKETFCNAGMRFGNVAEPLIREYYEAKTGEWFMPTVVEHPTEPWMMASLDGINSAETRILEIKTCNEKIFEEALSGKVVQYYFTQGQQQLACVPSAVDVEFVFYHAGKYAHVVVERDEEFIADMIEKAREFYELCIVQKLPPPLSEKDSVEVDDEEWLSKAEEAKAIYREYKELEKQWKDMRTVFLDLSDGGSCHGGGIKLSKVWRDGVIDYKKMKEDGIDVDKYRKASSCSVMLTVEKEKRLKNVG